MYELPDLPYDPAALEPWYSAEIVELHHGKHHAAYVAGANTNVEQLAAAREAGDFATINQLEKNLAFNLSGHVLHSIFWTNLSPDGGGDPEGELAAAITQDFGSADAFRAHLTAATMGVQGSGWGALAWDPMGRRLIVQQIFDHQGNVAQASVPLLVIDAWEHAYYLQYRNVRADFVAALWHIVNWDDVAKRFAAARQLELG